MSKGGFDFSNVVRNSFLETKGIPLPKATSTGTTIVGCLFADGVVLGADTRATSGPIVADKNCEKVSVYSFKVHHMYRNQSIPLCTIQPCTRVPLGGSGTPSSGQTRTN